MEGETNPCELHPAVMGRYYPTRTKQTFLTKREREREREREVESKQWFAINHRIKMLKAVDWTLY